MKDKILVVIVTHNNPVLLQNMFESIDKHDAGYDYDILVADATSDNPKQLNLLNKLCNRNNTEIEIYPDDRVEANYNVAWNNHKHKGYKYYFFSHDDMYIRVNDWLKIFVDRMKSGYCEDIIKNTNFSKLPIGKVCAGTQFWRNYDNVLGYPVQCMFLKHILEVLRPKNIPEIFKYCDGDRVLISSECMNATQGFRNVSEFRRLKEKDPELFGKLKIILDTFLTYPDVGAYPRDFYPVGESWAKFSLTGEFMSSIDPLIKGYRSVGLKDDGYLEELHGFATPMQHDCITHYGSPNFRTFIGKELGCGHEDIKKNFSNKTFLVTMNKIYNQWLKENE